MPNAQALVKGNEVRIGGARVGVVKAVTPVSSTKRRASPPSSAQPRQDRRPAAGRLDDGHPPQVAARPQVPADRPRRLRRGLRGRRDDPGRRGAARTGRHRRVLQHVRREDPQRDPQERRPASATPSPVAGRSSTPPSAACGSWPKRPAGRCEPRRPVDELRRLLAGAGGAHATVAPVAETTAASSSPSTAPSPPSPGSPAPTSRKRSPRAPRPSTPRPRPAGVGPSSILRALLHRLQARRRGARRLLADRSTRRGRRHPGAQRLAGVQRPARADRRRAARLPGSPGRLQRPRPPDRHQRAPRTRRSGSSPRRRPPATTSPWPSATSPTRSAKATARRTGPAPSPSSRRGARTPRAAPPPPPPTAPTATTTSTTTPTRTPPRPARPKECEAGNEPYAKGKTRDRQRAGQPGHSTTRGQLEEGE